MSKKILIVGGGLSGLIAALECERRSISYDLFEASDRPGGRIKTDEIEGYRLDHGFQVYLDAYPEGRQYLDYERLNLKPFDPGAIIYKNGKQTSIGDPARNLSELMPTLFSWAGSLTDKLAVLRLKRSLSELTEEEIFRSKEQSTITKLRDFGFSEQMIDNFFKPFYRGIFLEPDLDTSSRMFDFIFAMFSRGHAAIPANGMEEIPKQLADQLNPENVHLNTRIQSVDEGEIVDELGNKYQGDVVLLATEETQDLAGQTKRSDSYNSVECFYYKADNPPYEDAKITLNAGDGLVNNVAVLSNVSHDYAPSGKALISVSVLSDDPKNRKGNLKNKSVLVKDELADWFGEVVHNWTDLNHFSINYALPDQRSVRADTEDEAFVIDAERQIFRTGDYLLNGSINAAMRAGRRAVEVIGRVT